MNKYWIVVGARPAVNTYPHFSLESAHVEACRLARMNRNEVYTVFEAIETNAATDVLTVKLELPKPSEEFAF